MPPKKVGKKGLIIHSQGREIVNNVSQFMMKEAEEGITIPLKNHRERTLASTKVSKSTYQRIQQEAKQVEPEEGGSTSFSTPRKKRPRISRKLGHVSADHMKSIRDIVYDFYITDKRRPTLKLIMQKILDRELLPENLTISIFSLRVLLKKMGFRWQHTEDKRKILMESHDIRLKRIKYLKEITKHRLEGWNVIYTDETYIHSSHTQDKGWFDDSFKGIRKPISKGQRLIIVHAGGESGFVPNGLLIFRSGTKSGDYHDDMNHKNFMTWVEKQLLPNLPPKSVLIVDNAPYHNVPVKKNVTAANRKGELVDWLKERNIPVDEKLTKPEIYEIIQENKFRFPIKYKLDDLLERHGHKVLRLPPYHPEMNPIEKIWALVKNWVASRNVTFQLADVERLTKQKFSEVTEEEWGNICQHVKKLEEDLIQRDHVFDTAFDSLRFTVNTGSSEESEVETDSDNTDVSESSFE